MGRRRVEENGLPLLRRKLQSRKRWKKPAETKSHFPSLGPEQDSGALSALPTAHRLPDSDPLLRPDPRLPLLRGPRGRAARP